MLLHLVRLRDYLQEPGSVVGGFHETAEATPHISRGWRGQTDSLEEESESDRNSGEHHRVHAPPLKGSSPAPYATVAKQEELMLLTLQEKLKILGWGEVGVGVSPFSTVLTIGSKFKFSKYNKCNLTD